MSLFTKSVLACLLASIFLVSIERLIYIYSLKRKKYREDYSRMDRVLGKVQMIRINFIKNYKYMN